jgi:hypothetical protein
VESIFRNIFFGAASYQKKKEICAASIITMGLCFQSEGKK